MEYESDLAQQNIRKEKFYRRISFWASMVLATLVVYWFFTTSPPDSPEVREMRMFFKENIMHVTHFIGLPWEERAAFAETRKHPFYKTYLKASIREQGEIKALVHISYDYTPNQYWFNLAFFWTIVFTTCWFLGLMTEAVIILTRQGLQRRRKNKMP